MATKPYSDSALHERQDWLEDGQDSARKRVVGQIIKLIDAGATPDVAIKKVRHAEDIRLAALISAAAKAGATGRVT